MTLANPAASLLQSSMPAGRGPGGGGVIALGSAFDGALDLGAVGRAGRDGRAAAGPAEMVRQPDAVVARGGAKPGRADRLGGRAGGPAPRGGARAGAGAGASATVRPAGAGAALVLGGRPAPQGRAAGGGAAG